MGKKIIRVLVVDDEPLIRSVFDRHLTRSGFSVICVEDAERALERLKTETVDIILLDNGLPGMTGLAALPKILKITKAAVIFMTGFPTDNARKDALLLGAKAFIPKPCDFDQIVVQVRALSEE